MTGAVIVINQDTSTTGDGTHVAGNQTVQSEPEAEPPAETLRTLQGSTPVFALPGHPVRAVLAFETVVLPAMRTISGAMRLGRPTVSALVQGRWDSPAGRREFVCAAVEGRGTEADPYRATPITPAAEISLHALARADALLVVPEDVTAVRDGDRLGCVLFEG